jgi:hypothetical protein
MVAMALASTLAPIELFVKADICLKAFMEVSAFVLIALLAFKFVKPLDDYEIGLLKAMAPWRTKELRVTRPNLCVERSRARTSTGSCT